MRLFRRKRNRPSPDIIQSPEGVPLTLKVAGLGVRIAAQLADLLLTLASAGAILILLAVLNLTEPHTLFGIAAMLFFLARVPYYVITELIWNGQTLGKRLMKIKVVSHDGRSLSTHAIVLRNLMKEAEIFLPGTLVLTLDATSPVASLVALAWVIIAFLIPLMNPYRQRLGDLLAGTHVIHLPQPVLLKDLAQHRVPVETEGTRIAFLSHQLDHELLVALVREGAQRVDLGLDVFHLGTLARRRHLAVPVARDEHQLVLAPPPVGGEHRPALLGDAPAAAARSSGGSPRG